ncbi:TPA: GntR family transcriptional regulator [Streptococcus agalactiae]|uniref:GntR family transcriptional regulator n=1 Tax=Streptococcus TaxID=1301 RepID=UPI0002BA22B6|nr:MULTISPECIES: GntR family transcriptional regulator [Streptococcus]AIK71492.1 GntR family transcriptional regulator [Streptococcus agalactiae]AIK73614.1 GntR family transcriptional regulator [Streptococcus agalactiae]AIK75662.1 GntR family transcriptional regulator [Streptococcus agalactiae]ARC45316.1 GntR family transcriptional regulator [Streptococcus agalactiae]EPT91489.1 GntR family transcriptional regulator [Streptococcus agalactiae BSU442]
MAWEFNEKSPIYSQIAEHIKMQIVSQEIKSGDQLPTVRELAQDAGVNPNTMQRAFTELEREGMVFSQRTSGRFVTEDNLLIGKIRQQVAKAELATFVNNMKKIGYKLDEITVALDHFIKEIN